MHVIMALAVITAPTVFQKVILPHLTTGWLPNTICVTTSDTSWYVLESPSTVGADMVKLFSVARMYTSRLSRFTTRSVTISSPFLLERKRVVVAILFFVIPFSFSHLFLLSVSPSIQPDS